MASLSVTASLFFIGWAIPYRDFRITHTTQNAIAVKRGWEKPNGVCRDFASGVIPLETPCWFGLQFRFDAYAALWIDVCVAFAKVFQTNGFHVMRVVCSEKEPGKKEAP